MASVSDRPRIATMLRDWRGRRRMSQLDLALAAGVSARHLSFIETGRSRPSAEMVMQLAEHLEMPLRDRNLLMLAAGYAPAYGQRDLSEPQMGPVRDMIDRVLRGHEPYPALVLDRHWGLVAANSAVDLLTAGVAGHLLQTPVNVLRLSLHPEGLAPRIVNLAQWRAVVLDQVARRAVSGGDPALFALHEELASYPGGESAHAADADGAEIAVALCLRVGDDSLSFISTATSFGTAVDVTVSELSLESFFPADDRTARALREAAAIPPGSGTARRRSASPERTR